MARLKQDTYRDSVELMRLSAELASRPGLRQFSAMMATPANMELLRAAGLMADALAEAHANDLCLAAEADDLGVAEAALAAAEALLEGSGRTAIEGGQPSPGRVRSLRAALAVRPDLNLALISVPGEYAAREARRALREGLHVMIFSDNVPLEEEVALKEAADRLGLLCMGPDCGTGLIAGVPLGFANRVRGGRIGLVGASGTGLQAVTCHIHQLGGGVSHALGVGGRDLSSAVGGRATLAAMAALAADPSTDLLVIISKPGDAAVEQRVLARAREIGKPVVVYFLGLTARPGQLSPGSFWSSSLDETARAAVALARGETAWPGFDEPAAMLEARAVAAAAGPGSLAGLFTGGTLASEAGGILAQAIGATGRNTALALGGSSVRRASESAGPGEVARLGRHVILDLGDDVFTRGIPHPIIDPSARTTAIERAVMEGASVLLLDVILGFGAHPDPAGVLISSIGRARELAKQRGAGLEVLTAVVGTDQDPQPASEQAVRLRSAGARVYETPTLAARVAAHSAALLQA